MGRAAADRIAYVMSQFPETHETFILRELVALDELGVSPTIVSLKRCRDKVVHPRSEPFMKRTVYAGDIAARLWFRVLLRLLSRPGLLARIMGGLWRWRSIGSGSQWKNLASAFAGLLLAEWSKQEGMTHLHCHWATVPASVGYFAKMAEGIGFSVTAHAWDIYTGDGLLTEKLTDALFTATCTDYNARHLRDVLGPDTDVFLNYHGLLEIPQLSNEDQREMVILAVGRLVPQKGFEHLIAAFWRLSDEMPDVRLRIAGSGSLRDELTKAASRSGVSDRIDFMGTISREQVAREMSRAGVLAVPSVIAADGDRDGIPNVILEAGAHGLPVVASGISGIPEAVVDGETGLLVEPHDEAALATALRRILTDRALAGRLAAGLNARVRERFDARKNARELADKLGEVAG
jgi:glycosyltransferase involved in cell wall biosynthesis